MKPETPAPFVAMASAGIRDRAEKANNDGYYFKSHTLQALANKTAQACAEWLHRRIREDWGFPDPPEMTMAQRFKSRYRGKRCPNLENQTGLWKLLRPVEIGVQLTEGIMMDREATADASYCRCRVLVPACPVGGFPRPPVPLRPHQVLKTQ